MTDRLDNGDTNASKGDIRSIIDAVEVEDRAIRIIGSRDVLQAVIAGQQNANGNIRGFVRKWRARRNSKSPRIHINNDQTTIFLLQSSAPTLWLRVRERVASLADVHPWSW
jgi:hypothetical protein